MNTRKDSKLYRMPQLLAAMAGLAFAAQASASVFISVGIAPPPLPVYEQPVVPGPGYIWVPGYWAWSGTDYYWVPGSWELPPAEALLWTPGYWGWYEGSYRWYPGYWGPHVGFYGGVAYGYGYTGFGYQGGYWHEHTFFYNTAVNNVNVVNVHNTYVQNVTQVNVTKVSYNGGQGGVTAAPRPEEIQAEHERHFDATQHQLAHEQRQAEQHGIPPDHWKPQQAMSSGPRDQHVDAAAAAFAPHADAKAAVGRVEPAPSPVAAHVPGQVIGKANAGGNSGDPAGRVVHPQGGGGHNGQWQGHEQSWNGGAPGNHPSRPMPQGGPMPPHPQPPHAPQGPHFAGPHPGGGGHPHEEHHG
jgi:WXXGXW repeat (2 copies)